MSKEQIANSYIEQQKATHSAKHSPEKRIIAITGATISRSIGREIASGIAEKGHKVLFLEEDVRYYNFDFSGATDLIMCHGKMHLDWIENIPEEAIKEIIDVNLYGSTRVAQQFIRQTIELPYRKKIISIGSMAYKHVLNASATYCASKAGLAHFMKCIAWELAPKAFDIYTIHPSNTLDTPMSDETISGIMRYRNLNREDAEEYWSAVLPKKQFLTKREISEHVNYLLFNNTQYLSGSQIELAGGQR